MPQPPKSPPLRVAVVGAGPAGSYAADILCTADPDVTVDIFDKLPTPYGLIRYGVAPDHPRIKGIITSLHQVLSQPRIRFFGNVRIGSGPDALSLDDLRRFYDAIIVATGAEHDRTLDLPGVDLPGSHGAAEFVSFYDSHPDRDQRWDLSGVHSVAVLGVGNVALDVSRILARTADELLYTEIPPHVHAALKKSTVTDVHMFARRGPAQAKFTPVELRDLDKSPNVQVVVDPAGMEFDEASDKAMKGSKSLRMVVDVLSEWALRDPRPGPHRRIHIHFLQNPVAILGDDRVTGLRTERQVLNGDATVSGTGEFTDWDVQAVFRAVGYRSVPIDGLPWDPVANVLPNVAGRVLDSTGTRIPGVYATGWVKRGPVGLIGSTKSDAAETIANLVADAPALPRAPRREVGAIVAELIARGLPFTDFTGWDRLDAHERALGEAETAAGAHLARERVKVISRDEMTRIARAADDAGDCAADDAGDRHA
jgi:ferredoxin--NADP+ reductase